MTGPLLVVAVMSHLTSLAGGWWLVVDGWWVMVVMGGEGMMRKVAWYCLIPTTYHLSAPAYTSVPAA
jgi:hypothetical protein